MGRINANLQDFRGAPLSTDVRIRGIGTDVLRRQATRKGVWSGLRRKGERRSADLRALWRAVAILVASLSGAAPIGAANTPQFTHSSWTSIDGVPGMISALAQTPDGYLWLGTYEGLYRFDGVTFERIAPAAGHPLGAIPVTGVFVTKSGQLWVGYAGRGGVEVYRNGRLHRLAMDDAPGEITGFAQDHEGAVYAIGGREPDTLTRYWQGHWQHIDGHWGVPSEAISSLFTARDGTVWMATKSHLLFLREGSSRFEDTGETLVDGAGLGQDAAGEIWISGPFGTRMVPDYPHGERQPGNPIVYPAKEPVRRVTLIFDADGAMWGSTYTGGLFRIAAPGRDPAARQSVAQLTTANGLTSNQAVAILQDREKNIWAATEIGLDQYRRADVIQAQLPPRTSARGYTMTVDRSGAVYIASGEALYRAGTGEEPVELRAAAEPTAICPDPGGGVWMALAGRIELIRNRDILDTRAIIGDAPITGCGIDGSGRLWIARPDQGVATYERDHWAAVALPAGANRPKDIVIDRRGNPIIVLSNRALLQMPLGGKATLLPGEQIGVTGLTGVFPTDYGLLIAGGTGLALWDGHDFRRLSIDDHPWLRGIRGLAQTPRGETWLLNNKGINRVATSDLRRAFDQPRASLAHLFLGEQDGLISHTNGSDGLQAATAGDGRVWFLTRQGPIWVDPARLTSNPLAPTVLIRGLTANGKHVSDPVNVDLVAGTRNLSIDYTALSLSVPSRVGFRYKLEGIDADWVDPGERRQAFYTNLGPGSYRFVVIASNNKGLWNLKGAELRFTIPPTFLESRLFLVLCVALVLLLLWLIYDLRVRTISRRMRIRAAERTHERERIARELHDTLLQGIQALMLRFHVAAQSVESASTKSMLDEALDRAEDILLEGRERVSDLRVAESSDDIEGTILALAGRQELPGDARVHVVVKGKPRTVNRGVIVEIERIISEALFNILRHARAKNVSVELGFHLFDVTIAVRDDGVGIPADILAAGERPGHFGLPGMRERARQLSGSLTLKARPEGGTEVRLSVPARVAFRSARSWPWSAFRRGPRKEEPEPN
jgi:signal transduction histidine kinase/ligand-binding sensor domain-containing protein